MGPAGRLTGRVITMRGLPRLLCQVFSLTLHSSFSPHLSHSLSLSFPLPAPFLLLLWLIFISVVFNPVRIIDSSRPIALCAMLNFKLYHCQFLQSLCLLFLFCDSTIRYINGRIHSICLSVKEKSLVLVLYKIISVICC